VYVNFGKDQNFPIFLQDYPPSLF